MKALVELKSTITESKLVCFDLPPYLNNLSEEDQIKFINNYVKQSHVEFLATNETTVSAVKFSHEIKDLNYNPEEVVD